MSHCYYLFFFFFNDTATTEIYTLSLHDALPISIMAATDAVILSVQTDGVLLVVRSGETPKEATSSTPRSEEHTSELQSLTNLVCRLLLEKKKKNKIKKQQKKREKKE